MSPSAQAAPTAPQLRYLRALAAKTGTTFAYPSTRGDASREIDRLRRLESEPPTPAEMLDGERVTYATAVHPSEVSGFGASATWRLTTPPRAAPAPRRRASIEATERLGSSVSDPERLIAPARAGAGVPDARRAEGRERSSCNGTRASVASGLASRPGTSAVRESSMGAPAADAVSRLGRYQPSGEVREREIVGLARPDGSTLIVDLPLDGASGVADARVLARLADDEPSQNAQLICDMYLGDPTRGRCRRLTARDLVSSALSDPVSAAPGGISLAQALVDAQGGLYVLRELPVGRGAPELRWTRSSSADGDEPSETVALRDVVAALEDYEPARTITAAALVAARGGEVCTRRLAREAQRVAYSPIVLNRGLRQAVEASVAAGLSMSEIAIRCGRIKHDRNGRRSGETTWLARRIGQLPGGREDRADPLGAHRHARSDRP